MPSSKIDLDKFRELLVMAIVKHDLPFQVMDYEGIRALFSYVCDDIKLITRNIVKSDVLSLYKREKDRLKILIKSIMGRISLTSDLWTSIATDGYLCLTAHFVDSNCFYRRGR